MDLFFSAVGTGEVPDGEVKQPGKLKEVSGGRVEQGEISSQVIPSHYEVLSQIKYTKPVFPFSF